MMNRRFFLAGAVATSSMATIGVVEGQAPSPAVIPQPLASPPSPNSVSVTRAAAVDETTGRIIVPPHRNGATVSPSPAASGTPADDGTGGVLTDIAFEYNFPDTTGSSSKTPAPRIRTESQRRRRAGARVRSLYDQRLVRRILRVERRSARAAARLLRAAGYVGSRREAAQTHRRSRGASRLRSPHALRLYRNPRAATHVHLRYGVLRNRRRRRSDTPVQRHLRAAGRLLEWRRALAPGGRVREHGRCRGGADLRQRAGGRAPCKRAGEGAQRLDYVARHPSNFPRETLNSARVGLARIARTQGDLDEALKQYDLVLADSTTIAHRRPPSPRISHTRRARQRGYAKRGMTASSAGRRRSGRTTCARPAARRRRFLRKTSC